MTELEIAYQYAQEQRVEYARDHNLAFARYTMPKFQDTGFHKKYYRVLDAFVHGVIKKLIISCPPQHGKSQGSSINVPAMMIGRDPDLKIATVCYSATKARKFGRKVKQLLSDEKYIEVFGNLKPEKKQSDYTNSAEEMEIVGYDGFLKNVGYQGGLTGDPVDVLLMDDLYKDWKEAKSPLIRENVKDWYNSTADTRLHNDSQQLIVFTRWDEDDLVGFIESKERVVVIESLDDIEEYRGQDVWFKINFEAIKTGEPTEIDPRQQGEPLWPERHSLAKLEKSRSKDPLMFDCLHQGNPSNAEGLLYHTGFEEYTKPPQNVIMRRCQVDTADTGTDYLAAVVWDETSDGYAYIVDLLYTQKPMDETEPLTANILHRNGVRKADFESNNGGKGFARKVEDILKDDYSNKTCKIEWYHQSANKEARIISNSATVCERIKMPLDWAARWPEFYTHVMRFKRIFRGNEHDDCADVLTSIVEQLVVEPIISGGSWYSTPAPIPETKLEPQALNLKEKQIVISGGSYF
jgi:predicted phage terminase large subunit-like protein